MQIRNRKASRRVKLSMNKFASFSAEGKFSVEISTERGCSRVVFRHDQKRNGRKCGVKMACFHFVDKTFP